MEYVLQISTEARLEQNSLTTELISQNQPENTLRIDLKEFNVVWTREQMAQVSNLFQFWTNFEQIKKKRQRIRETILFRPVLPIRRCKNKQDK